MFIIIFIICCLLISFILTYMKIYSIICFVQFLTRNTFWLYFSSLRKNVRDAFWGWRRRGYRRFLSWCCRFWMILGLLDTELLERNLSVTIGLLNERVFCVIFKSNNWRAVFARNNLTAIFIALNGLIRLAWTLLNALFILVAFLW